MYKKNIDWAKDYEVESDKKFNEIIKKLEKINNSIISENIISGAERLNALREEIAKREQEAPEVPRKKNK